MKIGIIGGGASGLVAAIASKSETNEVILFERNKELGKKILATGNGRCNFWNEDQSLFHFESSNSNQLSEIINPLTEKKVKDFWKELGILPKIKNGYYYPNSNQACTVRNAFEEEIKDKNITVKKNYLVETIDYKNSQFLINKEIAVDKLVLATGGYASPKTGSTGMGYEFLKKMNHTIRTPLPSLVQLNTKKEFYLKEWKGIRCDVNVTQIEEGKAKRQEQGEIQLTDYGISGICVFNLSNAIARGLLEGKKEIVEIDFLPNIDEIEELLFETNKSIKRVLEGLLPNKLVPIFLKKAKINENQKANELQKLEEEKLIQEIKHFSVEVISTKGFEDSQVTSGGVLLEEINLNTMESKRVPGLYIIGEVLDLTGDCGGYNLGICFRTALVAGEAIRGEKNA